MKPSSLGLQEAKPELYFPDFQVRNEYEVQCSMRLWANWAERPKVQRHWLDGTITRDISVLLGLPPIGQLNGMIIKGHHSHCSLSERCPQNCAVRSLPAGLSGPATSSSLSLGLQGASLATRNASMTLAHLPSTISLCGWEQDYDPTEAQRGQVNCPWSPPEPEQVWARVQVLLCSCRRAVVRALRLPGNAGCSASLQS